MIGFIQLLVTYIPMPIPVYYNGGGGGGDPKAMIALMVSFLVLSIIGLIITGFIAKRKHPEESFWALMWWDTDFYEKEMTMASILFWVVIGLILLGSIASFTYMLIK